ncbi:MAG: type VI secretion system contractile sheath large subunit [Sulfurifustaceae bacterium]
MLGSVQEKLTRVRPPRVKIVYDVETGGAIEKRELPFIVGIFADLSGQPALELPPVKDRKLVEIDRDNFNAVMASAEPAIRLNDIPNVLPGGEGNLSGVLTFSNLDDFGPLEIVKRVPAMTALYQARCRIRDMHTKSETSDPLAQLLDKIMSPGDEGKKLREELKTTFNPAKPEDWKKVGTPEFVKTMLTPEYMLSDASQRENVLDMIGQFTADIAAPTPDGTDKGAGKLMTLRLADIDAALAKQLNAIMHAPAFQRLEATWRGLFYLVSRSETGRMLRLRVMNISKQELLKDLQKAVEFDQSTIFKLIYEAEYGTYGGDPYSLLLGDYEFGRHPEDIELLYKMAEIAAAAHAPFISAAYARLFDLDSFEKLTRPRDLSKIFESVELDGWRSFRASEDSRYVTLTLPRVLLRLPYGPDTVPVEGMSFTEEVDGRDAAKFLWGNSAYILAERITNAFSLYGWTAAIRGVEGGGLVEGLPTYKFRTAEGDVEMVCPTQVAITDRREKELNDLGFMAICHCKGTNKAAFFGGQTTNLPKKYISDAANSNAQVSAMLPYVLAAARFAHYIKVIMREKVGSFLTRANVEQFLNAWIAQYVLLDDNATQQVKAAYPLRAAQVTVTDVPGKPGAYRATVFLKPHFQLEELTTSIRLVAELPA